MDEVDFPFKNRAHLLNAQISKFKNKYTYVFTVKQYLDYPYRFIYNVLRNNCEKYIIYIPDTMEQSSKTDVLLLFLHT